jgi:hypothetical protein
VQYYPKHIVKRITCPCCGEENRIRFGFYEMMLEASCESSDVPIQRKRKIPVSAHGVSNAFSDSESEIVVPKHEEEEQDE